MMPARLRGVDAVLKALPGLCSLLCWASSPDGGKGKQSGDRWPSMSRSWAPLFQSILREAILSYYQLPRAFPIRSTTNQGWNSPEVVTTRRFRERGLESRSHICGTASFDAAERRVSWLRGFGGKHRSRIALALENIELHFPPTRSRDRRSEIGWPWDGPL